jgi:hypothetical protein
MDDNESLPPATDIPETAGGINEPADARVERILEYVDDSLKENDALQATIGAAGGDLMLMLYRVRQALDETLTETPNSLTAIAEVMPAMNTYMKLSQQVGQYVQLSLKIKSAKGAG